MSTKVAFWPNWNDTILTHNTNSVGVCILFYWLIISILVVAHFLSSYTIRTKLATMHTTRLSCRHSCSKTLLNIIIACSMWYIHNTLLSCTKTLLLYLTIIVFDVIWVHVCRLRSTHYYRMKDWTPQQQQQKWGGLQKLEICFF